MNATMQTPRTIGILGGMGPAATILLQQRLLEAVTVSDDNGHIPLLIDLNPQVPSRIAHLLEGGTVSPAPTLAQMARRLEQAGAMALAMPCNTAHHYAPAIQEAIAIPFLHMVQTSIQTCAIGSSIGILASPAVQKTKVFDAWASQRDITLLWPNDPHSLLESIKTIKTQGFAAPVAPLQTAATELMQQGASQVLIACSEFSMLAGRLSPETPYLDTIDILVKQIKIFAFDENPNQAFGASVVVA